MTSPNGALLVDKAPGWTSHDVVAKLRGILRERQIGHAGTLDPMATGLLVLGVGPSTRLLRFAQVSTKTYTGTVQLGSSTSSLDADGEVTATASIPQLTADTMNATASAFVGAIMQVAPMVSARKVNGERLYDVARRGETVEREPREIVVSEFVLSATEDPAQWEFRVICSAGTYVRVLLSDLAEAVGTLGHLVVLRRVASGNLHVREASTLDELSTQRATGEIALRSPRDLLGDLPIVELSDDEVHDMRHGRRLSRELSSTHDTVGAQDASGQLVGVLRARPPLWKPDIVLPEF